MNVSKTSQIGNTQFKGALFVYGTEKEVKSLLYKMRIKETQHKPNKKPGVFECIKFGSPDASNNDLWLLATGKEASSLRKIISFSKKFFKLKDKKCIIDFENYKNYLEHIRQTARQEFCSAPVRAAFFVQQAMNQDIFDYKGLKYSRYKMRYV